LEGYKLNLVDKYIQQFRNPSGFVGRLVGINMNFGHQRLYKRALNMINRNNIYKILDIGCGGGRFIQMLSKNFPSAKIYGIDYSETMVKTTSKLNRELIERGRVIIRQGSVSKLPFSENSFDLVTGIETCYFWSNLSNDLKEVKRVLKPGASLILVNEMHEHHDKNPIVEKLLNKVDLNLLTTRQFYNHVKDAGFTSIEIETKGNLIEIKSIKPIEDIT